MTNTHSDDWHDRIQDALDNASGQLNDPLDAELRAHVDSCEQCRTDFAKLTAIHRRLRNEFARPPALADDFSASVFARIDAQEAVRRAAKANAELEFRRRSEALSFDWRGFFQRHFGNVIAMLTVAGALLAALGSTLTGLKGWLQTTLGGLPLIGHLASTSNVFALPMTIAFVSTSIAGATIWWLQSRSR